MSPPPLLLASTSPYRRALLDRIGVPYSALPHQADERAPGPPGETPDALALRLAVDKARSVAPAHPDALVLASDQVVDLDGEVLGKPGGPPQAIAQLGRMAGRTHRLLTAIALAHPGGRIETALDVHRMTMCALDAGALARYVARDEPWDCAGSYRIEAAGISLFSSVQGDDFTAIVGLPLLAVARLLRAAGYVVP